MLDFMRRHAQSWMIKAALGAVVVVFIFWGIWTPRGERERELAIIGNYSLTVAEARNYYQNLVDQYRSLYGSQFNEEMAKKLGLKERAIKDLINKALLLQEARRLGLTVTAEEIQTAIESYPAFQKDGHFDKATYLRTLQRMRLTAKEFESNQAQMLLISKIHNLITAGAKVADKEVWDNYRHNFEKINLEVIFVNPEDFKDISFTTAEVQEYFTKHKDDFKIPARVKIRYLLFDPKDYQKDVQITPSEIENYYQNNLEKFTQPRRLKVRHILIKTDFKDPEVSAKDRQKAESIREEALKGKDFAELAKKYSDDQGTKNQGGDLGYISRGQVIPEFEAAIFSLKAGEISKVIQTPYGYHIAKVDEIQEQKVEPLEKVQEKIQTMLKERKARELAYDQADEAYARGMKDGKLDSFAQEKNLRLKETGLFSAQDKIDLNPKLIDSALALNPGDISPVLRLGDTLAILQVVQKEEARNPELQEVEDKVVQALKKEKQKEKALAKAKDILEKIKKGAEGKALAAQEKLKIEETGFFERAGAPPKMEFSEELRKAIFTLLPQNPYAAAPILLNDQYVILRLKEVKEVDQKQFQEHKENFRQALLREKQEMILSAWLEERLEEAKAKGWFKMKKEIGDVL
ncbi:MAG: SurA N-terminal domain-containing protein [Thermodesulfobacteriota bacterium]